MEQNKVLYGLIGAVIGGLLVWLVTSSAVNTNNTGMMRMIGMGRGPQQVMRNAETINAHFIEQMIPHHEDAITMARLAQTRAARPEVKQLAENIITSQSKEIEQMKVWYQEWYGREVPEDAQVMQGHGMMNNQGMHMGMMGDETDMTRLETSSDFDRAFVEEMIPHHQMAVMMASMLKTSTQRPEMQKLADDIIATQTEEIDQMREWLRTW